MICRSSQNFLCVVLYRVVEDFLFGGNMQKKSFNTKVIALLLCLVLTLSIAFGMTGCGADENNTQTGTKTEQSVNLDGGAIGEGKVTFAFTVVDAEGNETQFEVSTDQTTVGAALLENGLIAGDEGAYGLYVKSVNGITADYDKDQTYWAFYINGEYAATGVDVTDIVEGDSYAFKVEK